MPLTVRLIVSPSALTRPCAAGRALLCLLVLAAGADTVLAAAGPTSATPAPGKGSAPAATRAATAARTAVAPKVKPTKPAKPATSRLQLKREAEGLALATTTVETITEAQLDVALRVLTGQSDCEFNERVTVLPMDGQLGHFLVGHKGQRYTMVPEETATGAVRLVDRQAGVVWLQIPVKSMLMNAKQGRRMIDACTHADQRLAALAVAEAGNGLGIVPIATATTAVTAVTAAPAAAVTPEDAATPAVAATPTAAAAPPVAATPPAGETPVAAATPTVVSTPAAVSTLAAPAAAVASTAPIAPTVPPASLPPATPSGPGTTLPDMAAAPAAAPR